jgi:hypothetical protein
MTSTSRAWNDVAKVMLPQRARAGARSHPGSCPWYASIATFYARKERGDRGQGLDGIVRVPGVGESADTNHDGSSGNRQMIRASRVIDGNQGLGPGTSMGARHDE